MKCGRPHFTWYPALLLSHYVAPRRPFGTGGAFAAWGEGERGGVEEEGPKNRPTATPGDSGTFGSGRV